jgi:O-antigen ligase
MGAAAVPVAVSVAGTGSVGGGRLVRVGTSLALVALVYAAAAHGGFYSNELKFTVLVVAAGLAMSRWRIGLTRRDINAPVLAVIGLGLWYVAAGAFAHDIRSTFPALLLLGTVAATVLIVLRADATERRWLLTGLVGVGVLVAATGWIGVAWRVSPYALEDGGLWRAASTITYANATGGLLAALALLTLGAFVVEGAPPLDAKVFRLAAYLLVVGLLASASRAALIGFAAGLAVLTVSTRGRVWVQSGAIFGGAVLAIAGLAPSMLASNTPRPWLACAALVLGAAIAIAPRRGLAVALAVTIVLLAMPTTRHATVHALQSLRAQRVTASSPDRSHELHAALHLAHDHPIIGVGPGHVDLTWTVTKPEPTTMHIAYAHNEYLQVLDESGLIGFVILAIGFVVVALSVWRARRNIETGVFAGCLAALVALALHSSMDFLWHIPLLPLTGAVLVGAALADPSPPPGPDPTREIT